MPEQNETITLQEWQDIGRKIFGTSDCRKWAFRCPFCHNVATVEDFDQYEGKGATVESAYRECIGRYQDNPSLGFDKPDNRPCDYSTRRFLKFAPYRVEHPNGMIVSAFAFAGPVDVADIKTVGVQF